MAKKQNTTKKSNRTKNTYSHTKQIKENIQDNQKLIMFSANGAFRDA